MSYDLFFYKKRTDPVTKSDIEAYLNRLPNREGDNEDQWFFKNGDSGAYWSFEFYTQDENEPGEVEPEDTGEGFEDFEDTNFSFNINYVRPNFFAQEAFPIADKLAQDLGLYILNPQAEPIPMQHEKGTLQKDWTALNQQYARGNFDEWGLNYLEEEKSAYASEYNRKKAQLQQKYGEGYFVPKIFFLKKHGSRIIETLCVWPENVPYVLPKVDLILIQKKIKVLFWSKLEDGLISYNDLTHQLGNSFADHGTYLVLDPTKAAKLSKAFNKLKLFSSLDGYGESISVDRIVNTKPETELV